MFNTAAAGTRFTGIDVALSELAKRGIVGFKKPAVEQKVDELSLVHQSHCCVKTTAGRTMRVLEELALLMLSGRADLVMSVESKSLVVSMLLTRWC